MKWADLLIVFLGSSAFAALVNQICNHFAKRAERKSGMNKGIRLILKNDIRTQKQTIMNQFLIKYIEQGWIYEDELEDIIIMHECYHNDLGGNGYLDELMKRVKSLPIHGVGV